MGYSEIPFAALLFLISFNIIEAEEKAIELLQVAHQQSCKISDLHLAELESVVSCFPDDFRTNIVLKEYTECLVSEDHNGKNQLALRKCLKGKWADISLGEKKHQERRFLGFVSGFIACVFLCRRSGGGSIEVIKYPPSFGDLCRPADILDTYSTAARHTTVNITWTIPQASDRDGTVQSVVQISGLPSGSKFIGSAAGRQHVITYKATDNDGLTAYCSFTFTVFVQVCLPVASWPINGYRSCDLNTQLGSVCLYNCNDGYVLNGNRTVTCQGDSNPSWTETPFCERITCNEPATLQNGAISCHSNNYGAVCPIRCNTGYKLSGMTYIQCQMDGTWTSIMDTTCTDNIPPEISCITPQTFYADRGLSSTTVKWVLPIVTDTLDPNATVTQIGGQVYGSVFNLGSSVVSYRATDSDGNESGMCSIVIIVEETICKHPYDILQDANIEFNCNSFSYSYGTECELSCRFHYSLVGTSRIVCERADLLNPAIGSWSWGNGEQPYCNLTECPILEPPINGALARGYVGTNAVYTMLCNSDYTIPELYIGFSGQWICQNSGTFIPATPVPDCVVPRTPRTVDLPAEIFYYDGDCSDPVTQMQIVQNVRQILQESVNPVIRALCPLASNCTTGNVEITCGEVTGRKRRSSSKYDRNGAVPRTRQKRQNTPTLIVNFYIITTIVKTGNQSVLQAIEETDALQSRVLVPFFEELVANGTFDQEGFSLQNDSYQSPQYGNVNCQEPGYKLRQLICEPCPPTYFLNTSDTCEFCPIGTYSDIEGLTSCKHCPPGYITLKIGSRNESQCKELCPAGSYSNDGVVPCIACSVGYYQNSSGQSSCLQCDTGTTEMSGSTSTTQCQAFHILVNDTNGKVAAGKLGTNMTNISVMFWARRFADLPTMTKLLLTSETSTRIVIEMSDKIRVTLPGTIFDETVDDLDSSIWTHVAITWDTINGNVLVYVKGQLVVNKTSISSPSLPVITNGSLELQSTGSTGVYIADLHIEDGIISPLDVSLVTTQCWTERKGDVFNMNSFRYQTLGGVDIQTPTFCDPVDDCTLNPCNNQIIHHTCIDGLNNYTCFCVDGYTGKNCEVPPDYCVNASCLNGASCLSGINGYTCSCRSGYSGDLCDVKPVDGGWSVWSDWSECSACGEGNQNRSRSCDNPEPSPYGANCTGDSSESRKCSLGSCQNMECPPLERGFAMVLNCSTDPSTRIQTCKAECLPGFIRPEGLGLDISFTCGSITGYNWEPMTNPPDCVDPTVPDRLKITAQINTSTSVHVEDESSYKDVLVDNLSDVPCISSGLCSVSVEVETPITESNFSTISVDLIVNLSKSGPLEMQNYLETSNASAALQEVIDSVNSLEESAHYFNSSASSLFNVTVGETTYTTDSIILLEGNVKCAEGHIATDGVCAPCPDGTYYRNGNCAFCEKGSYSLSNGQTSCTPCLDGLTTVTIGSHNATQCIESDMSSTTKAEFIPTEPTEDTATHRSSTEDNVTQVKVEPVETVNRYLIVGIVIASVLCVVAVTLLVIFVLRRRPKPRSDLTIEHTNDDESSNFETECINNMQIENNLNATRESQQNMEALNTNMVNSEIVDTFLIESEASKDTSTYINDPCQPISKQHLPVENIYLPMDCYNSNANKKEEEEDESTVYAQIKD